MIDVQMNKTCYENGKIDQLQYSQSIIKHIGCDDFAGDIYQDT
jgi:hypothetical protein